jgi:hypothetical protein
MLCLLEYLSENILNEVPSEQPKTFSSPKFRIAAQKDFDKAYALSKPFSSAVFLEHRNGGI